MGGSSGTIILNTQGWVKQVQLKRMADFGPCPYKVILRGQASTLGLRGQASTLGHPGPLDR